MMVCSRRRLQGQLQRHQLVIRCNRALAHPQDCFASQIPAPASKWRRKPVTTSGHSDELRSGGLAPG